MRYLYGNLLSLDNGGIISRPKIFVKGFLKKYFFNLKLLALCQNKAEELKRLRFVSLFL